MSAVSDVVELFAGYTLYHWVVFVVSLATVALGLVIGYHAYRGFRRNDSRSMQYLSIGLILLTAVPYTLTMVGTFAFRIQPALAVYEYLLDLTVRVIQFGGLAFIAYSLYEKP